jgi:hypothetical protein
MPMTNGDPSNVGKPLAEVLIEVSKAVVAARLEALFPGLELYATQQHRLSQQRRQAIMARAGHAPATLTVFPPESLVLTPDYILDHAKQLAQIDSDRIGEDQVGERNDVIARRVLRTLWTLEEDVLTVSHVQRCFRLPASCLVDFVVHGASVTGDKSLDGDDLFVCTRSARVIVLHHEGWVFDVTRHIEA